MAVIAKGLLGSASATSAGTTLAVTNTTGAIIPAGTFIHITGTWDNIASVTAPTITCSTIGGATATANHGTAVGSGVTTTAGAGIWHQCFRAVTTADIAIGGTIATLTSNQSAVKRAAHCEGWSGALNTLRGTVTTATSTTGTATVTTTGTALVVGDLVIGSASFENNSQMTADADTAGGSWPPIVGTFTTGGAAGTNVGTATQYKILTATGTQTFNPTGGVADTVVCVYSVQPEPEPTVTQAAYQWFDEGTESGAVALAAQDTAAIGDITNGDATGTLRVRLQSTNASTIPATDDWQLQWEKNASGTWTTAGAVLADNCAGPINVNDGFTATLTTMGQSFLGTGVPVSRASFYLIRIGTPTGSVFAEIYAHTGTYGAGGMGTGSPLATSAGVVAATLPTAAGQTWVSFAFDGTFTPTNGTPYVLAITHTTSDASNLVASGEATGGHSGNSSKITSGVWGVDTGDRMFELYVEGSTVASYNSPNLTDGAATTNRLTGSTGTFVPGKVSEDGLIDDLGWGGNNFTELVYALKIKAADVANGDALRFRVLRNGATTGLTYTQVPTISIISPPMPNLVNTFEGGTSGTTITTANSGGDSGDALNRLTTPAPVFDNAHAYRGAMGMRTDTGAQLAGWDWTNTKPTVYWRGYLYMTAYPSSIMGFLAAQGASLTTINGGASMNTVGQVRVFTTYTTASLPLNQWVRVEVEATTTGGTIRAYWTDPQGSTPDATVTQAYTAADKRGFQWGNTGAPNPTWYWDEIGVSETTWLGPTSTPSGTPTVTITRSTTWRTAQAVTPTRATTWDSTRSVALTRSTTWDSTKAVELTRSTTWNIERTISLTRVTTWDSTQAVALTRVTTWDDTQAVALTRATTWDSTRSVALTRSATWDSTQTVELTRTTTWDSTRAVELTRVVSWDTNRAVALTRTTSWNVAAPTVGITGSWVDIPLPAPLQVTAGTAYRASISTNGDDYGDATGIPASASPHLTGLAAYNSAGTDVYPATAAGGTTYYQLDVLYREITPPTARWRTLAPVTPVVRSTTWNVVALPGTVTVTVTRSTSWDVLTPVPKTLATTWRTRTAITKTPTTTWNTKQAVTKALSSTTWRARAAIAAVRSTTWDVTTSVALARSTTWDVTTAVALSRSTTWDTTAPVQLSRSSTWNQRAQIQSSRSTTWDTRVAVASSRASTWDVTAAIALSRGTTWRARASITLTRLTTWDDLTSVGKALGQTSWRVRGLITVVRPTSWNVAGFLAQINVTRIATWNIRSAPVAVRSTTWDVLRVLTANTRSTTWRVNAAVAVTRSTTWRTKAAPVTVRSTTWRTELGVTISRQTLWDARTAPALTRAAAWDVLTPVATTRSTTWRARAAVATPRSTTWDVLSPVALTRASTWNVRAAVTRVRSTTWNVFGQLVQVTITRSTTWGIDARITLVRSTTWDSRSAVAATTRSTTWRARQAVSAARTTTWRTRVLVSTSRSSTWRSRESVPVARVTSWDVTKPVLATRSTTWDVLRGVTTLTRSTTWRSRILVVITRSPSWDTRAVLVVARSTTWDTRIVVVRARVIRWDARSLLTLSRSTSWKVKYGVSSLPPGTVSTFDDSPLQVWLDGVRYSVKVF